jgi:16S rRNA (uracil1498-N3)-methyltransferase
LQLPPDRARYLARVLRAKKGQAVVVADGRGGEYPGEVLQVTGHDVELELGPWQASSAESSLQVCLALAVTRGERMDTAIQKAVELGVTELVPVFTKHCVARLEDKRAERRVAHWQEIARNASEQCGRDRAPPVHAPLPLSHWLNARNRGRTGLVFDPLATQSISALDAPVGLVIELLIGPEGGLAEEEIRQAEQSGMQRVRLGERVLRAETAAMATVCAVQLLWGDLGSG